MVKYSDPESEPLIKGKGEDPEPVRAYAIDDEKALLFALGILSSQSPSRVRWAEWYHWVRRRYREPLDPGAMKEFWYDGRKNWLTDLSAFPNWSLFVHYFNTGVALNLLATPVSYYLVESLEASPAVVNTYTCVTYLPWCLKIFFGLQSDLVPWLGTRRRSYFCFGWLLFIVSNVWLALLVRPGVAATLLLSFAMTMGCLFADTVADALVLECSRYEAAAETGRMRTKAYIVRQVGSTLGSVAGAVVYNSTRDGGTWAWGLSIAGCFWLQGGLVLATQVPLFAFMYELVGQDISTTARGLWREMFDFVALDGVWVPMMFLYGYSACFVSNPAWYNFMYDGLGFSNFQVGLLYTVGSLLSVAGLVAYNQFFFQSGWRYLYFWTTVLSAFFSLLQVLLITGDTFGAPKILFATGDISLQEFFQTLTFMPMCIMFFSMIPSGAEGTAYALISTWTNVAGEVGTDIGTALACPVDVSDNALSKGNWTGILKLTLICSGIQLVPLFFIYGRTPSGRVHFLPDNIQETQAQCLPADDESLQPLDDDDDRRRRKKSPRRSNAGAWAFFTLFFGSILASVGESLWVIFSPSSAC